MWFHLAVPTFPKPNDCGNTYRDSLVVVVGVDGDGDGDDNVREGQKKEVRCDEVKVGEC